MFNPGGARGPRPLPAKGSYRRPVFRPDGPRHLLDRRRDITEAALPRRIASCSSEAKRGGQPAGRRHRATTFNNLLNGDSRP